MINGSIISLAWPETKVIREGKWYDLITKYLGVLKGEYYTAGHAALVLLDHKSGDVHYFDFGRYHTPLYTGRVRSEFTDPELKINTKCKLQEDHSLHNLDQLLFELRLNPATHGDGTLYASEYQFIDFEKALEKANNLQAKGIINYGPLKIGGTNCSRFVASVALAGETNLKTSILLRFPYTISPSPRSNTRIINNTRLIYKVTTDQITCYKQGIGTLIGLFSDNGFKLLLKPITI